MAGGTWTAQNKVRPGIYINFKTGTTPVAAPGTRGTVAIAKALSWGPVGQVMTINAEDNLTPFVGYAITEPQALFLREMFKGTNTTGGPTKVLLYRLTADGATSAEASIGTEGAVTVTARYPGARGNDISVVVTDSVDDPGNFTVSTVVGGQIVDEQQVQTAAQLQPNGWVTFAGNGQLSATAGVSLTGGADGTVQSSAYASALEALEPYPFDILAYDGGDTTVLAAMTAFVKRLAEQSGRYTQLVASGAAGSDSRFVINNKCGVVLTDGTHLTPYQVVWWLAGAEAGAQYYQPLSYSTYPGAAAVSPKLTDSEIEAAILAGDIVLSEELSEVRSETEKISTVRIETDVNTLTTYTQDIGEVFHKNRTMRVCNSVANDLYREFSKNFLGRVNNDESGRSSFKATILDYLRTMYNRGALRERPTSDDVTVEPGSSLDSIIITIAIRIADSVEKVYVTVSVS